MINYESMFDGLDINKGDTLFVSSDVTKMAYLCYLRNEELDLNMIINTLQDKVTNSGMVIFPTYNWGFCKGKTFDYKKTPSKVGALSQCALKREDFIRTKHPIYSFALWGRDSEKLAQKDYKSAFGADSLFQYFYDASAKNLYIGVDYVRSGTFTHHVEEKNNIPYRFLKEFTAQYIDNQENESEQTYSMLVRPLDECIDVVITPMFRILQQSGALFEANNEYGYFGVLDMRSAYDLIEEDVLNNKSKSIVIWKGNQ